MCADGFTRSGGRGALNPMDAARMCAYPGDWALADDPSGEFGEWAEPVLCKEMEPEVDRLY